MMSEKKKAIPHPVTDGVAKVPVVIQLEALECGAAALTMVLDYYGKWIPLEQVRRDCGVSRDGSNALNILKAARYYGLNANGYRFEPEDLKKSGKFPCIIHWNFNHFVVLKGFKKGKACINDPAQGSCEIPEEVFNTSFTGICLMFEPSEQFCPEGKKKSIFGFVKKHLSGAKPALVFVMLTTLITSLICMLRPGFTRVFLDRLLTGKNPDWLGPFILALTVLSAVEIAVNWVKVVYGMRLSGKFAAIGNSSYMWHVLRLPMNFFSQRFAGDIRQRQSTYATITETLINTFAPLIFQAAMTIFYLIVMVRYSLLLTAVGLGSIVVNVLVLQLITGKRVNISRIVKRDQGRLYSATAAGIDMIETIKASGAESGFFSHWSGYQAGVNTGLVRDQILTGYLGLIPSFVTALSNVLITLIGVWMILAGKFEVGMVLAFQGYLQALMAPASGMMQAGQIVQEMRTDMERVEDVMDYPLQKSFTKEDSNQETPSGYEKLKGEIELKNVTFGYAPLGAPLIKDFSLKIKPGSFVAFVGASGCGKSTLSKLISGLEEPWSGEILFDGMPISKIDRAVFAGSLSVADQDVILFEDTIANNLRMWDTSLEESAVILAAKDAKIHDDIMERSGGYHYMIREDGKDFSGGQRQRLEIARMLVSDPVIMILDEATSALDAHTEYEVMRSIRKRGITCIMIAHRLSTIRDCDEIIVIDQGVAVERGTHEELFAKGGIYTQLVCSD